MAANGTNGNGGTAVWAWVKQIGSLFALLGTLWFLLIADKVHSIARAEADNVRVEEKSARDDLSRKLNSRLAEIQQQMREAENRRAEADAHQQLALDDLNRYLREHR